MRYKFFSLKYMTKGHVDALRRSRRILASDKIVHYDGAFMEHLEYEQALYVLPVDDWVLNELEGLEIAENGEYDYKSLSSEFKRYMRFKDDEFF